MRILILGGDGMLGHQCLLSWQAKHDVKVTLRRQAVAYEAYGLFTSQNSYYGINVMKLADLRQVIEEFQPEAVVNCVGVVKQLATAKEAIPSIHINALFPHQLTALCAPKKIRVITMSTDCIFDGQKGLYTVEDESSAKDLYG